jgi:membrane fusion protein, copper/silver efflux system
VKNYKKVILISSMILVMILLGLAVQTGCKKQTGPSSGSNTVTAQTKEIYYCPMHPQVISDKPGNCPICGMTLVKKEAVQPAGGTK